MTKRLTRKVVWETLTGPGVQYAPAAGDNSPAHAGREPDIRPHPGGGQVLHRDGGWENGRLCP